MRYPNFMGLNGQVYTNTNQIIVSSVPCVDGLPDYFTYIRFQGYEDPLL